MSEFGPVLLGDLYEEYAVPAQVGPVLLGDLVDAVPMLSLGPVLLGEELEVKVPGITGRQITSGIRAVATVNLVDGVFSADVAGRAKMADGYFNEATFEAKVDPAAITAAKLKLSGQTYDFSTATALRAGTPVAATDVANKTYVDGLVNGLNWQPAVNLMFYVGTRTIAQINALSPAAGWTVVAGSAGTPTAGTSDALVTGDLAEFNGTSWIRIVTNVGGFPPNGTRAVVAWPSSATLHSPLVDNTDEGKIAQWAGASLTPTLTTPVDGWAVLCRGPTNNPPTAFNENKGFSFTGTVPAGSWNQVAGPVPYAAVGEITTVNGGDAASAGTSANLSRGDHQHAVATAAAVDVSTANAEGASVSLARADHTHRSPKPVVGDKARAPAATAGNYQTTALTITGTPALDGGVSVLVNGVAARLGNGNRNDVGSGTNNVECYFSGDAGATARLIADIVATDVLYWNGAHAGYDLAVTDVIDLLYETF